MTKFNVPDKNNKKKIIIIVLVVLIVGVLGFFGYSVYSSRFVDDEAPIVDDIPIEDDVIEKTVMHPLTGVMYTPEDAAKWQNERPIGIMVNNHVEARPQWGIGDADLTYEIVAEGGITRYLAFFQTALPEKIGPVRSTREYYLVLVKELGDAMIMHIGWSPQALEAIQTWPVRSLTRGGAQFDRDQERLNQGVATEHTAYVNGPYLRELGNSLGWEGTREYNLYEFKDDQPILNLVETDDPCEVAAGHCDPITVDFWYSGDYSAIFEYDPDTNEYLKYTGYDVEGEPIPTIDANNDEQLSIKNLIVQFVTESPIVGDDKNRLEYQLVGSGEGIVFIDGTVQSVTWTKIDRNDRTMFYDQDGKEVQFNRGNFWISIVPDRNVEQVSY